MSESTEDRNKPVKQNKGIGKEIAILVLIAIGFSFMFFRAAEKAYVEMGTTDKVMTLQASVIGSNETYTVIIDHDTAAWDYQGQERIEGKMASVWKVTRSVCEAFLANLDSAIPRDRVPFVAVRSVIGNRTPDILRSDDDQEWLKRQIELGEIPAGTSELSPPAHVAGLVCEPKVATTEPHPIEILTAHAKG